MKSSKINVSGGGYWYPQNLRTSSLYPYFKKTCFNTRLLKIMHNVILDYKLSATKFCFK